MPPSYLQALVGERDSYLKTGGLAPLTNNQRYIQWRMLLLIPVRFTYDTKEVKTTAIVNKTHLTYHKGIGERK